MWVTGSAMGPRRLNHPQNLLVVLGLGWFSAKQTLIRSPLFQSGERYGSAAFEGYLHFRFLIAALDRGNALSVNPSGQALK